MTTFGPPPRRRLRLSTPSVVASHVQTSPQPAKARASLVSAPASGMNTSASSKRSARGSSLSKTSAPVSDAGSPTSAETLRLLATLRWPWNSGPAMSARHTAASVSSLSGVGGPTPTAKANLLSPSMAKWAGHARLQALLPTPSAVSYGSNKGGAAGRVGKERASLATLAKRGLLPTPAARDFRGPNQHLDPGHGDSLPKALGQTTRCLSPRFVEWMMGFPRSYTDLAGDDERT